MLRILSAVTFTVLLWAPHAQAEVIFKGFKTGAPIDAYVDSKDRLTPLAENHIAKFLGHELEPRYYIYYKFLDKEGNRIGIQAGMAEGGIAKIYFTPKVPMSLAAFVAKHADRFAHVVRDEDGTVQHLIFQDLNTIYNLDASQQITEVVYYRDYMRDAEEDQSVRSVLEQSREKTLCSELLSH
ncbi:hypothetical protein D3C72_1634750 [compost metagenome]